MRNKKVVIASNNAHKAAEIAAALDFEGWEFCTLSELGIRSDPDEDAGTFEGNARIKARAAHEAAGCAALADDSGLAVDALGGAPGVLSARFAGMDATDAQNNSRLLRELEGVAPQHRSARFVCTLVFIDEDGSESVARGALEGSIGFLPAGEGGFGYDPLFYPDCLGGTSTLAQMTQEEKNSISHRGNALRQLRAEIAAHT